MPVSTSDVPLNDIAAARPGGGTPAISGQTVVTDQARPAGMRRLWERTVGPLSAERTLRSRYQPSPNLAPGRVSHEALRRGLIRSLLRENSANARGLSDTERYEPAEKSAFDLRLLLKTLVWISHGTRFEGGGAHQVPRHLRRPIYLVRWGVR